MKALAGLAAVAFAVVLVDAPAPAEQFRAAVDKAPTDVRAFIQRRAGCNHFLGEEPYDPERAAQISRAMRELRCQSLSRDERALRGAYRSSPATLKLIDQTADFLDW